MFGNLLFKTPPLEVLHKALTAASLHGSPLYCQEKSCFWCWVETALHSQPTNSPTYSRFETEDRGQDLSSNVYGDCSFWTSCCDDAGWPSWCLGECEHMWPQTTDASNYRGYRRCFLFWTNTPSDMASYMPDMARP